MCYRAQVLRQSNKTERCKIYMKSIEIYGTVTTIVFRGVKEAVCFIENGALLSFKLRELPGVDFCCYV